MVEGVIRVTAPNEEVKQRRGFALLPPERRKEIAKKGGQSVPNERRSFSTNRALAARAGRKGGQNIPDNLRTFFRDRELAARAGSLGGRRSAKKKLTSAPAQQEDQLVDATLHP